MVSQAMNNLAANDRYTLLLTGTETTGSVSVALETRLSIQTVPQGSRLVVYAELVSRRDGVLQYRAVADGERLWVYDRAAHTYTSWSYNRTSGQPDRNMLLALRRAARGTDSHVVQAALDAYDVVMVSGGGLPNWQPGLPVPTVSTTASTVNAQSTTPHTRDLTYEFALVGGSLQLARFALNASERMGAGWKVTQWNTEVYPSVLDPATVFSFNPGTARPISLGLRQSSG